jgi:hypothetical protein
MRTTRPKKKKKKKKKKRGGGGRKEGREVAPACILHKDRRIFAMLLQSLT